MKVGVSMMGHLPLKGKLGFAAGGGINAIGNFLHLSLLMIFLTDVVGIDAAAVGVMMLIARIWDAINDPMCGILIDRSHGRNGKTRPWITAGGACMAVFCVLMFFSPDSGSGGKLAWSYFSYIGFGMSYTACILAVFTLTSRVTLNPAERVSVSAWYNWGNALTGTILGIFGLVIIKYLGNASVSAGYLKFAAICGALVFLMSICCTYSNRELQIEGSTQNKSLKRTARNILKNRPLLIIVAVAMLLVTGNCISNGALLYYVTYNLKDDKLFSVLAPMAYIGMALSSFAAGWFAKRVGKRKSLLLLLAICVVCYAIRLLMHDSSLVIMFILNAVFSFCSALYMVIYMPMIVDMVDYGEYITGERDDAVIMAADTFQQKLGMGIASAVTGFILDSAGYVPNAVEQQSRALDGIFACTVTIPLVLYAAAFVLLLFYKMNDKELDDIRAELDKRRNTGTIEI